MNVERLICPEWHVIADQTDDQRAESAESYALRPRALPTLNENTASVVACCGLRDPARHFFEGGGERKSLPRICRV